MPRIESPARIGSRTAAAIEVGDLRALLVRERAAIEGAHRVGASGAAVVRMLSDLMDRIVVELARRADGGLNRDPSDTREQRVAVAGRSGRPVVADGSGTVAGRSGAVVLAESEPLAPRCAGGWAFVALGGYGRRELSPWSDVDVMLLHESETSATIERLATAVFHGLWDLGLNLGHSVRTVPECLEMAERDLPTRTSLLEARRLVGSVELVKTLENRMRARLVRRSGAVSRILVGEMHRGYAKHGSSLYMLEPNVKRSGGGLRTIQFGRWIALARHGTADLGVLHARGLLIAAEGRALREAQEFYWRVRNDLHFAAGHASDTVSFEDQVRLARAFGYRDDPQRLGVERFMQTYYIHATKVHEIVGRFIARTTGKSLRRRVLARALGRRVEGIFLVTPDEITLAAEGREQLLSDPLRMVSLFHVAQARGREIDHAVLDEVRAALEVMGEDGFRAPAVAERFLDLLATPERLADTLSLMHRTGVLGKLLPEFAAVTRLVQFNRFHKYTVDEHTFAVIRTAEALLGKRGSSAAPAPGGVPFGSAGILPDSEIPFADGAPDGFAGSGGSPAPASFARSDGKGASHDSTGPVGRGSAGGLASAGEHLRRAYRQVKRKDILHLAMLLHDVGKAGTGDHSAAGAAIAASVARRLGFGEHDARLLVFLVREHLTMEQVALRRDLNEEKVLLRFACTVANAEALRMLFVLTCADIAGVGPGSLTAWKEELLTSLYVRAMEELSGGREVAVPGERLAALRTQALGSLTGKYPAERLAMSWAAMNDRYLLSTPVETVVRHLEWLAELGPGNILVKAANENATGSTVYTVLAHDQASPGLFAKIAGVLAAMGLQVLRARLDTRKDGIVLDTFEVVDTFFAGPPPEDRLREVEGAIRDVLVGRRSVGELFARHRRFQPAARPAGPRDPTKVVIDNESSDDFSVIEVFARDKQGLLYVIASGLRDLRLSVHSSKVATRLDQILDVFYVTDAAGGQIVDPDRLETIERTLVKLIQEYECAI